MQRLTLLGLLFTWCSIIGGTLAGPAPKSSSAFCKAITNALAQRPGQSSTATRFCSTFLGIKTQTVTSTSTVSTTVVLHTTITAPTTATVIDPTVTSTTTLTLPSTSVFTVSATDTSTISTSTLTTTVTSGTSTTTTNACVSTAAKRDVELEARATACPTPKGWQSYRSSVISSACSCLSLTTPTSTASATKTSTISTTSTSIFTNTVTSTPTSTSTSTTYLEVDSTTTTTTTTSVYASTTTTSTVQATATTTNNICAANTNDNELFWLGIQATRGDYNTGAKIGSFPTAQMEAAYGSDNNGDVYYVYTSLGRVHLKKTDNEDTVPADTVMYLQDGINGGPVYFGDLTTVTSNGYYNVVCQIGSDTGNGIYGLTCYNANGVQLTVASQTEESILGFYLSSPSGYTTASPMAAYPGQLGTA